MFCCARAEKALAQYPLAHPVGYGELVARLERQERELYAIRRQLDAQMENRAAYGVSQTPGCGCDEPVWRLPAVAEVPPDPSCASPAGGDAHVLHYQVVYDRGFVLRPLDPRKHPFELKVNGRIQFRHAGFDRDVESWTDNAGVTEEVRSRNNFDIERARLVFSGYALSPRSTYYMQLDGDTDDGEVVEFLDYWWAWEFSEPFQVQVGKRKVPAVRQWVLSSRNTRLVDRPMANDFFRPDRTTGIFLVGDLGEAVHYEMMAGNGYSTANLPLSQVGNQFTFAATSYWDPLGEYGRLLIDYDATDRPLLRIGHSAVFSAQDDAELGVPTGEADFLRLTDGTILIDTGALAPGVTVSEFDIFFYGVDLAAKWGGFSINAEIFLRWLEDIRGDGALPLDALFQKGFYVEGGTFVVARKLDVNVRYSQVSGLFGDSSEYAAGFNWFPLDSDRLKFTFDVTLLDGSPLDNTSSDILVGDDGTLYRAQLQAEF